MSALSNPFCRVYLTCKWIWWNSFHPQSCYLLKHREKIIRVIIHHYQTLGFLHNQTCFNLEKDCVLQLDILLYFACISSSQHGISMHALSLKLSNHRPESIPQKPLLLDTAKP